MTTRNTGPGVKYGTAPLNADAPVAKQPTYPCRVCDPEGKKGLTAMMFGTEGGKRATRCLPCQRAYWNKKRVERLKWRTCLSCKQLLEFTEFDMIERRDRNGVPHTVRSWTCKTCTPKLVERHDTELLQQLRTRAEKAPRPADKGWPDFKRGAPDYTEIAEVLLFGKRVYKQLNVKERRYYFALARELAKTFSPTWPRSREDAVAEQYPDALTLWARRFIVDNQTLPLLAELWAQKSEREKNGRTDASPGDDDRDGPEADAALACGGSEIPGREPALAARPEDRPGEPGAAGGTAADVALSPD